MPHFPILRFQPIFPPASRIPIAGTVTRFHFVRMVFTIKACTRDFPIEILLAARRCRLYASPASRLRQTTSFSILISARGSMICFARMPRALRCLILHSCGHALLLPSHAAHWRYLYRSRPALIFVWGLHYCSDCRHEFSDRSRTARARRIFWRSPAGSISLTYHDLLAIMIVTRSKRVLPSAPPDAASHSVKFRQPVSRIGRRKYMTSRRRFALVSFRCQPPKVFISFVVPFPYPDAANVTRRCAEQ